MTSIRFPIPEVTEEDKKKWLEMAKKHSQAHMNRYPPSVHDALIYGLKWNCEHDKRPGECDNPKCVAEYIHDE